MSAAPPHPSLGSRLFDWLFGRDFFISYRWSDGRDYAVKLAQRLKAEGFDCFLDSDGFIKGDDWRPTGDREIRKTSRLVLLGTPDIHASEAVARELAVFGRKQGRLIAVEFGDALSREKHPDSPVLANLDPHIIRQLEPLEALAQPPSEALIQELRRTFTVETTAARRRRVIRIVTGVLAFLFVTAVVLALVANDQRHQAVSKQIEASMSLASANWQLAEQARDKESDPIKAAHLFRTSEQAYEEAKAPDLAKNAALGSKLALEKASLLRVFPNDRFTGIEDDFGNAKGTLLNQDRTQLLTWYGSRGHLWALNEALDEPLRTFEHQDIQGAEFTANGEQLLLWGRAGVQLFKLGAQTTEPSQMFVPPAGEEPGGGDVYRVELAKDGKHLLTHDHANGALLWPTAPANAKPLRRFELPSYGSFMTFNGSGSCVLACIKDSQGFGVAELWSSSSSETQPIQVFSDHTPSKIEGAVFSPDDSRLLTWTSSGEVRVWSVGTKGTKPQILMKRQGGFKAGFATQEDLGVGGIRDGIFTKDGSHVLLHVALRGESMLELWKIAGTSLEPVQVIKHPGGNTFINGMAFSKDERRVYSWDRDMLYGCAVKSGGSEPVPLFEAGDKDGVADVRFSLDENRILSFGTVVEDDREYRQTVCVWERNLEDYRLLQTLTPERNIKSAEFCQSDTHVLVRAEDGSAQLYEIKPSSQRPIKSYQHGGTITGAVLDQDESRLLAWSDDGRISLCDSNKNSLDEPLVFNHPESFSGLSRGASFVANRTYLLSWASQSACLWKIDSDGCHQVQAMTESAIEPNTTGTYVSKDGSRMLRWNGRKSQLWVFNGTRMELLHAFEQDEKIDGAILDNNASRLLSWTNNQALRKWNIGTAGIKPVGDSLQTLRDEDVGGAVFSNDGSRVASFGRGNVQLWDFDNTSRITPLTIKHPEAKHDGAVHSCSALFTGDGRRLLVAGGKSARLWSIDKAPPKPLLTFTPTQGDPVEAVLTKNGSRLLIWGSLPLRLWAIGKGIRNELLYLEQSDLAGATFTQAESHILTWSRNGFVKLWEIGDEPEQPAAEGILELEVRTGTTLYDGQNLKALSFDEWLAKKHQWDALQANKHSR